MLAYMLIYIHVRFSLIDLRSLFFLAPLWMQAVSRLLYSSQLVIVVAIICLCSIAGTKRKSIPQCNIWRNGYLQGKQSHSQEGIKCSVSIIQFKIAVLMSSCSLTEMFVQFLLHLHFRIRIHPNLVGYGEKRLSFNPSDFACPYIIYAKEFHHMCRHMCSKLLICWMRCS